MIAITLSSPDWDWQTAPLSLVDNRDTALWLVEPYSASKASAPSPQQESKGRKIKRHKMCSWSWVFHHLRVDQSGFLVLFDICEEVVRLLRIFHLTILKRPLLSSPLVSSVNFPRTSLPYLQSISISMWPLSSHALSSLSWQPSRYNCE